MALRPFFAPWKSGSLIGARAPRLPGQKRAITAVAILDQR
jgi:hypothetical protein